jgi:hypothetical protein
LVVLSFFSLLFSLAWGRRFLDVPLHLVEHVQFSGNLVADLCCSCFAYTWISHCTLKFFYLNLPNKLILSKNAYLHLLPQLYGYLKSFFVLFPFLPLSSPANSIEPGKKVSHVAFIFPDYSLLVARRRPFFFLVVYEFDFVQ